MMKMAMCLVIIKLNVRHITIRHIIINDKSESNTLEARKIANHEMISDTMTITIEVR